MGFGGADIDRFEELGTLRLIFEEDFSLMSQGSFEEPARDLNFKYPDLDPEDSDFIYPWWNILPEYTHAPHWGANAGEPGTACPAGGSRTLP